MARMLFFMQKRLTFKYVSEVFRLDARYFTEHKAVGTERIQLCFVADSKPLGFLNFT